jgi:hypothetical protein
MGTGGGRHCHSARFCAGRAIVLLCRRQLARVTRVVKEGLRDLMPSVSSGACLSATELTDRLFACYNRERGGGPQ